MKITVEKDVFLIGVAHGKVFIKNPHGDNHETYHKLKKKLSGHEIDWKRIEKDFREEFPEFSSEVVRFFKRKINF
jgi:hemerythrin superfamily protein